MLVATTIEVTEFRRQPKEKSELLYSEIRAGEVDFSLTCVGCLDQCFEHVERSGLDTIAEEELLAARKPINRRNQPEQETGIGLQRRDPCGARDSAWEGCGKKISLGAAPPDPLRRKDTKTQGVSVPATRKPPLPRLPSGATQPR
jgi:hypothetical protein